MSQVTRAERDLPSPPRPAAARESYTFSPSLVMLSQPTGGAAEAIRALRTHMMAQHVQGGRRALAVCAPTKGVGCTFIAANLAVALSQIGIKTLVIDGDLRSPTLHQIIRPPRLSGGLRQVLNTPDAGFGESIEGGVLANLSVMYSGGAASNPLELLSGDRFQVLMDYCMREFDITIVDTPPANTCSDARRIANVCGYGLVVASRNKTLVDDVKTLSEQLRTDHARIIGSVLNEA